MSVNGGVLRASATSRLRSSTVGLRVGADAVASVAGAIVIDGGADDDGVGVVLSGGTVEFVPGAVVTVSAGTAVGLDVQAGTLGGRAAVDVNGTVATGIRATAAFGGVFGGSIHVEGAETSVGVACTDAAFDRLRLRVIGPQSLAIQGDRLDVTASVVESAGDGVAVAAGGLRHVTIIAAGVAVTGTGTSGTDGDLTLTNSLQKSPGGTSGAVVFGVVGFAGDLAAVPDGCTRCIFGPGDAVGEGGVLATDEALTTPNPFVDSGDPQAAVPFDVDGRAVPQGLGPDLGGLER
jgi:adhesin HecA-like repeat protein